MSGRLLELVLVPWRAMRRAAIVWGAVLALFIGATVAFWPAFKGTSAISQAFDQMPSGLVQALGMQDIGSPAGFLRGNLYDFLLPLLLIGAAVTMASGQTAGEEDAGRLELYLAQPVTRTALWAGRVTALVLALAVVAIIMLVAQLAVDARVDLQVPTSNMAATVLLCAPPRISPCGHRLRVRGVAAAAVVDARAGDRGRRGGIPRSGPLPAQRHPGAVAPRVPLGLGVRRRPARAGHGCLALRGTGRAGPRPRGDWRPRVRPTGRARGLRVDAQDPAADVKLEIA
jgi:hypothetical protein